MQLSADIRDVKDTDSALIAAKSRSSAISKTPEELANIVSQFASSDGWLDKVRLRAEQRWYERLYHGADHDIWVLSWLPGQSTGFHDHGASSGAFVVATGILEEHRPGKRTRVIYPGNPRAFGPDYVHDVRNVSLGPAISIHAYSPPLADMNEYELEGNRLVPRERAVAVQNRSVVPQFSTLGDCRDRAKRSVGHVYPWTRSRRNTFANPCGPEI